MTTSLSKRLSEYSEIVDRLDDLIALESLREIGVFRALLSGPMDLESLARATGTAAPRIRACIDLVHQLGFLERDGERYRLVEGDAALFDPEGPVAGNPGVPDLQQFLQRRGAATKVLRTDTPLDSAATGGAVSAELRAEFLQYVHDLSRDVADEVAALLKDFGVRRFADLGCGPGTYSLALLKEHPEATATLVDRPNAAGFVTALCAEAGLQERTEFKAKDILCEDYGQGFDLILLSENIHNFGPAQNLQLLQNVARSLASGGRVAIKDTRVLADRSGPVSALRFAVALSLFSPQGTLYTEAEVVALLEQAGLQHKQTLDLSCRPESYLIIAQREQ